MSRSLMFALAAHLLLPAPAGAQDQGPLSLDEVVLLEESGFSDEEVLDLVLGRGIDPGSIGPDAEARLEKAGARPELLSAVTGRYRGLWHRDAVERVWVPESELKLVFNAFSGQLETKLVGSHQDRIVRHYYYFWPDGRVYGGFPLAVRASFDFARAEHETPGSAGRYEIEGRNLSIPWGGGRDPEAFAARELEPMAPETEVLGAVVFHFLRFVPPRGWGLVQPAGGTVALVPAGSTLQEAAASFVVGAPQDGEIEAWLARGVESLRKQGFEVAPESKPEPVPLAGGLTALTLRLEAGETVERLLAIDTPGGLQAAMLLFVSREAEREHAAAASEFLRSISPARAAVLSGLYRDEDGATYYLAEDGSVYQSLPKGGLEGFDFFEAEMKEPKRTGRYHVVAGSLVMVWGDDPESPDPVAHQTVHEFRPGPEPAFGEFSRVSIETAGLRIRGKYARHWSGHSVGPGNFQINTAGEEGYVLTRSGYFQKYDEFLANMDGKGAPGTDVWGNETTGDYSVSQEQARQGGWGAYRIGKGSIELDHADGQRTRHTFLAGKAPEEGTPPDWIEVDGTRYFYEEEKDE